MYKQLSKEDRQPLRYECFQSEIRQYIASLEKHKDICEHINDLYELISYQMREISKREAFIVSKQYQEAWKHYDRSIENWDLNNRRFFTEEELKSRQC